MKRKSPEHIKQRRLEESRRYREKNRKKVNEASRRYRDAHYAEVMARDAIRRAKPENRLKARLRGKAWRERNREYLLAQKRNAHLLKKYGMSHDDYLVMLARQNNVCAICKTPPRNKRRLAVDHDHNTQQIRGLLCEDCNRGLGLFRDDTMRLFNAVEYLSKWNTSDYWI